MAPVPVYLGTRAVSAFGFALFATLSSVRRFADLGFDPLQLVLVGTVLEATVFLLEVPTGVVADVYSRKISVVIGFVVIGLGFMAEALVQSFAAVLMAQVVWGAGSTFVSGAFTAWMVDEVGDRPTGPIFLRGTQAGLLGTAAGIVTAALLGNVALHLPLLAGGLVFVALGAALLPLMPEQGFTRRPPEERESFAALFATLSEGVRTVRGNPVLVAILVLAALAGAASEGVDRLWELHMVRAVGLPEAGGLALASWIAVARGAQLVLGFGAAEWLRRRVDVDDPRRALRMLLALTAAQIVGIAAFGLASGFALGLCAFLAYATSRQLAGPVLSTWTNQLLDSRTRATVLSIRQQSDAFGQVAGGPALGGLGRALGSAATMLAVSALLVPMLGIYARIARRPNSG